MEAEMDDHLRYEKSERSDSDDYQNGYKPKRVNSSYLSTFEAAKKWTTTIQNWAQVYGGLSIM